MKELNTALTKRDRTIEELLARLRELEANQPSESRTFSEKPLNRSDLDISLIQRQNEDMKRDIDEMERGEDKLKQELNDLRRQNDDLKEVLNPMKKEKNKFYDKYFEQQQRVEDLEGMVASLKEDNVNLKLLLEKQQNGSNMFHNE